MQMSSKVTMCVVLSLLGLITALTGFAAEATKIKVFFSSSLYNL